MRALPNGERSELVECEWCVMYRKKAREAALAAELAFIKLARRLDCQGFWKRLWFRRQMIPAGYLRGRGANARGPGRKPRSFVRDKTRRTRNATSSCDVAPAFVRVARPFASSRMVTADIGRRTCVVKMRLCVRFACVVCWSSRRFAAALRELRCLDDNAANVRVANLKC